MLTRIAHITDSHLDEELPTKIGVKTRRHLEIVLDDIKKENINQIIFTGDIGEGKGVSYFLEQLKSFSLSITLGNHDAFSEISEYYTTGIHVESQKLYSSIEKDNLKYIFLDSSADIVDEEQLHWLQKELISSKSILIFIHHPVIGLQLKVDEIGGLKNRDKLLHILENCKKDVTLFCGHYHMESEILYKNIKQYITPAVSFQIEKLKNKIELNTESFGYRIIEIKNNNITSKVQFFKA
jgi:Icc protein